MALLPKAFNVSDAPSSETLVPEGKYLAHVVKSELKDNSKGTGKYLQFTLKILDGDYKDYTLFEIMNIVHQNKLAEDIGNRVFASLIAACDLDSIEDTAELHGVPICIQVATEEAKNGYPAKSKIKKYMNDNEYPG